MNEWIIVAFALILMLAIAGVITLIVRLARSQRSNRPRSPGTTRGTDEPAGPRYD